MPEPFEAELRRSATRLHAEAAGRSGDVLDIYRRADQIARRRLAKLASAAAAVLVLGAAIATLNRSGTAMDSALNPAPVPTQTAPTGGAAVPPDHSGRGVDDDRSGRPPARRHPAGIGARVAGRARDLERDTGPRAEGASPGPVEPASGGPVPARPGGPPSTNPPPTTGSTTPSTIPPTTTPPTTGIPPTSTPTTRPLTTTTRPPTTLPTTRPPTTTRPSTTVTTRSTPPTIVP